MARVSGESELREVGDGIFAYLQTRSGWGWSNAGLVTSGDASLLVDTLFDVALTRDMLQTMRRASPAAERIDTVVNTHANGDHCWGNQEVADSTIIASRRCAEEMRELSPNLLATLVAVARGAARLGSAGKRLTGLLGRVGLSRAEDIGDAADLVVDALGTFEFRGIQVTVPTSTFEGEMTVTLGDREVQLVEVGPAHTRGDVIAYVPSERVVFTGDILFMRSHPIIWAGPVDNWIAALDRISSLDATTVVPGHGPLTDNTGIEAMRSYLVYVRDEARARYDAGMTACDAALDIDVGDYAEWGERERLVANVGALYREFGADASRRDPVSVFGEMGRYAAAAGLR